MSYLLGRWTRYNYGKSFKENKMTVKECVLNVIIQNYWLVKNHLIEQAHPVHKMSGCRRLRELRKLGVKYTFDRETNTYDFSETPLRVIGDLLRGMAGEDEKGSEGKRKSEGSHPSPRLKFEYIDTETGVKSVVDSKGFFINDAEEYFGRLF